VYIKEVNISRIVGGGFGGPPPRKKFNERNEMVASGAI